MFEEEMKRWGRGLFWLNVTTIQQMRRKRWDESEDHKVAQWQGHSGRPPMVDISDFTLCWCLKSSKGRITLYWETDCSLELCVYSYSFCFYVVKVPRV